MNMNPGVSGASMMNRATQPFGSKSFVDGSKEFVSSNSMVAKVAFLLLIVLLFVYLLRIGSVLISWFLQPSGSPYLVSGMKNAKAFRRVTQNPAKKGSITVLRSKNEHDGLEFTYSTWMYIDDLDYNKGKLKHVFYKGSENLTERKPTPNCAPGLFLKDTNGTKPELLLLMNSFKTIHEEISIKEVPLNKWFNVIIRMENLALDVYVNGTVAARKVFDQVPKQNYGDVFVNAQGGYSGMQSSLRYFNKALTSMEIIDIVKDGPSLKMDGDLRNFPPYFSMRWYTSNAENAI
ncbi:MAG: hypothetical protein CML42_09710 [Rhodobacteraceae bacterium]|nr:hypothetical protein [Paracoccaceae bacterium]